MPNFGSYILYLLLITICFWFYLRYKIARTFYLTLTLLSFNLLRFISTPSNRSLTCVWFNLRYKIRKLYKA